MTSSDKELKSSTFLNSKLFRNDGEDPKSPVFGVSPSR